VTRPSTIYSIVVSAVSGRDTLPPADDRIYDPAAFGPGWLVAGMVAILAAVGCLVWALWRPRRTQIAAAPPQIVDLRRRYLHHLGDLERRLIDRQISERGLHHELSRTLRRFAVDIGTAGATSMSAATLDTAGLGPIATAVRGYERPQFDELPESDPWAALDIARTVVAGVEVKPADHAGEVF
jgi:hypothetical protein